MRVYKAPSMPAYRRWEYLRRVALLFWCDVGDVGGFVFIEKLVGFDESIAGSATTSYSSQRR